MSETEEKPVADVEADEVEEEEAEAPAADVPKEPLTINEGVQASCFSEMPPSARNAHLSPYQRTTHGAC